MKATTIIEAILKRNHFIAWQHFVLITDQHSMAYMLDNGKQGNIKKITRY